MAGNQHRILPWTSRFQLLALLLWFCLLAGNGCRVAQQTVALPGQMVTPVVPGTKSAQPDPAVLQSELLRYADDFFGRTGTGLDEYAHRVNTPKARAEALNWRLAPDSSAVGHVTRTD